MRHFLGAIGLLCGLCVALPAFAARVEVASGQLFIDRGNGYQTVKNYTSAKPGDTVMAKVGGSGVVIYEDGCRQEVDVGSVVTVSETSPCNGAWACGIGPADHCFLLGAAVVGGIVGGAIALSDDDDNDKKPITKNKK
jgi:hypothetical protein